MNKFIRLLFPKTPKGFTLIRLPLLCKRSCQGFTLIELLISMTVIGVLTSIGLTSYTKFRDNTTAVKIVSDFKDISDGWQLWRSTTGSPRYLEENIYSASNPEIPCHDEPMLSVTDLVRNVSGHAKWAGPYLRSRSVDPFGQNYIYDNDDDVYDAPAHWGGVNTGIEWCIGQGYKYIRLAPTMDQMIDKGDGPNAGKFRWDNTEPGGMSYSIARQYNLD